MVDWSLNMKAKEKKSVSKINTVRESKGAGSRRIFSPVFKLQVLDSYRQDADCQGNQRATARKYGIHRRQIQKWLQMETNLRVSVQQSNVAALNLSPARQCDANVGATSAVEVKCLPPVLLEDNRKGSKEMSDSDNEEYVNVDEITDSEEDETSSCSSHEKNDNKALDFTCATLSKRRFYPSDFKLHVVDAFKNDKTCQGNQRATARKFGIHRRQVQKWLNQEQLIKCEQTPINVTCLDLSSAKRKLEEKSDAMESPKRSKSAENLQESALCLVKDKAESLESNNNYHHVMYPSPPPLEHSFSNSSLNYIGHEYPLCVCHPWNYCCQPISTVRTNAGAHDILPKYSYSFNLKYETSYVDIPVQYGFGDSVPSKWIKENPLYLHEPPSIQVLSSYR